MIIDGKQIVSKSLKWHDIRNPATDAVVARVPESTKEEMQAAVSSAQKAFESWKEVSAQQRARVMMKFQALLNQHKDESAGIITEENGKTLADSHGDLYRGIEVVEHAMGIPNLVMGEFLENVTKHTDLYTIHQPLGVTAAICPFNFAAMIP